MELITSQQGKEIFETINELMSELENKNDPETSEIMLVESITSFVEKFQTLNMNLSSYVSGKRSLLGNKIGDLIERREKSRYSIFE